MSWGLGLRINIKRDLAARLYWGFGLTNKYDVGKEFPMITLRNNSGTVKRAIDEILWIWQKPLLIGTLFAIEN